MNSAAQVSQLVEQWKQAGLSKENIIIRTAEEELGWPYVWGATAAECTPSKRQYYAGRSVCPPGEAELIIKRCAALNGGSCNGCAYYPNNARVQINDCQGFVKQLQSRVGITLKGGGATSMYNDNSNWTVKGPIAEMPTDRVCCVFMRNKDGKTMDHVGEHVGQGNIIHCSGTVKRGKTTDKGWTHYAIPKGLTGDTPMPTDIKPTLRKGDRGEYVTLMQTKLIQRGYDLSPYGADGAFGNKTFTAVKQFQKDNNLTVDGIVGAKTWAALESEAAPLYTVTVQHVSKSVAEDIIGKFGGVMTAES